MAIGFLVILGLFLLSCAVSDRTSLSEVWLQYSDAELDAKQIHAELYQETLEGFNYSAGKLTMLEIGVTSGRSMLSWIKWFEDVQSFVYVGINAKPFVKMLDISDEDTIHIETRSDLDAAYLNDLCSRYGPFDVIVDNGLQASWTIPLLWRLFPCMSERGFYFIEYGVASNTNLIEQKSIVKYLSNIYLVMHSFWDPSKSEHFYDPVYSEHIKSIQMMHNLVVLERATTSPYTGVGGGTERIPFTAVPFIVYTLEGNELMTVYFNVSEHSSTIPHEHIKTLCREICEKQPILVKPDSDVEGCARVMKQAAIRAGFWGDEDFLYGDEPPTKKA